MNEISKTKLNKEEVAEILKKMVGFMNVDCQVEIREEHHENNEDIMVASIQTLNDASFLIGKNGQNLKALEHVIRAMLVKDNKEGNVILDINDYRKSRSDFLVEVAKQAVTRVRNSQKAEALFPMSAYERRIVHMELASYPDIATESVGAEPQRRVIIKPYP